MKAIVWTGYGPPDVLQLMEVDKPFPKDDEVLIKIHATTVTKGDCEQRALELPLLYRIPMRAYMGLRRPKKITILGFDLAGEIESEGKDVKLFKEGDQVFATTGFVGMGTNAEYICLPEEPDDGAMALKPVNMSFEEAAAVPTGGLEALCHLRKVNIQRGQKVLINGAGGTIGTYAVQLAKYLGAEVTGVDDAEKLDTILSIGADHVVDYTKEDFSQSGERYDVIFDVVGKISSSRRRRSLKENGSFVSAMSSRGVKVKNEDLVFLKDLIEAGKIKAVIDRCYPLEQIPEAHRYVEKGLKKGNVVITMADR
ncbi:MAG: NAD(P)-dependent alcohol dehydrogenase [Methanomassiliicoccales archaeon]|nr:NAD(P)-dependent alcohol dehydrogenase [Methanomassiliicoccales archaeon]